MAPRMNIKKTYAQKRWTMCLENMSLVLGSTVNVIGVGEGSFMTIY